MIKQIARIAAVVLTLAGIVSFDAAFGTYDHPQTATHSVQPDITIASCDVAHVPAFTRTDVCIDASGSIVKTTQRFTVRDMTSNGITRSLVTLF